MSINISYSSEFIGLILFYTVVTAENMSGAAMYELVSRKFQAKVELYTMLVINV